MTDIEQKALALVNEVREVMPLTAHEARNTYGSAWDALCRAIEQHEALRQEVSDAITECWAERYLRRFIIAKPDPLVEALIKGGIVKHNAAEMAADLRAAIEKRGGKIVWGEG